MVGILKSFLFSKNILINEGEVSKENVVETLFTIAKKFGIKITEGKELITFNHIKFIAKELGEDVPEAFYKNFPNSVKKLTTEQLLFDQLIHYAITYGLGETDEAGHSIFEEKFDRTAFTEETEPKNFKVVTEEEGYNIIKESANELLKSTRPLSNVQLDVLCALIDVGDFKVLNCASKDTALNLLLETRSFEFVKFIELADVIKLVEKLNYIEYDNENVKKLKFKSKDRKFITLIIRELFKLKKANVKDCFEKRKLWCGLLHHIHYKPLSEEETEFLNKMRGRKNESAYSQFESALNGKDVIKAVEILKSQKGETSVLRNLNYLLSNCETNEQTEYVLNSITGKNVIVLIQLLEKFYDLDETLPRTFKFSKFNLLKVHTETKEEVKSRKSVLTNDEAKLIYEKLYSFLKETLKDKFNKVYVGKEMENIALPISENTTLSGFGTLTKGSVIPLKEGKKIRAFTYWEKVNDIDLSFIGIAENDTVQEFSWRSMYLKQSDAVTFSGDETSGYNGGSEYFDIKVEEFKREYPGIRYLIFCDNVYSRQDFSSCLCKAGYMLRDLEDSGEVFEPKTVKSSFTVNAKSTFAYLFGIDLEKNVFVWLNTAKNGNEHVAGNSDVRFLKTFFKRTEIMNVYKFFTLASKTLVGTPKDADIIVTDKEIETNENQTLIRSYDTEKLTAILNIK